MHESVMILAAAAALVLAGLVALRLSAHREATPAAGKGLSDLAVPGDHVVLLVSGWSEAELCHILGRFRALYPVEVDIGPLEVPGAGDVFEAGFPQGIAPEVLAFLVNDLTWPDEPDPAGREIAVLARLPLCRKCGVPDPALIGEVASIYVPEGDRERDLVHLRLDDGRAFRIPFTDMHWHPTADARWPARLDRLAALAG